MFMPRARAPKSVRISIFQWFTLLTALAVLFGWTTPSFGISQGSTTLTITPGNTVPAGTAVTFVANVTPVEPGFVMFCNFSDTCAGSSLLGTAQVTSAGAATLRLVLGVGTYNVEAVYIARGGRRSQSSPQQLTVTANSTYPSSVAISANGNTGTYTLSSTVTGFGINAPSGNVSFLDSSNANFLLATATLNSTSKTFSQGAATSPLNVGPGPQMVKSGDFNGDGIPDLAVVDSINLTIFLGKGDGTFQAPSNTATGLLPIAIAVGDFNSDDILDLVVANYGDNSISVFIGNGDGTFQPQTIYAAGNLPESLTITDLNNDGIQDVVVINSGSNNVSAFLGNGDGTFQAPIATSTGNFPNQTAIADFNGDGLVDLAVANAGDANVAVFLGNGDGTFGSPQTFATLPGSGSIETGDFNNDGIADLVVGNNNYGSINIFLGNGDGTFQANGSYTTGSAPRRMALGDFNADNNLDIAIANARSNSVSVFLGNGDGTFAQQAAYPTGSQPLGVVIGDFNGDGVLDLATPNFADGIIGNITLLLGQLSVTVTTNNINVPGSGTHEIVASYGGDSLHASAESNAIPLAGGPAITTTTSLLPSGNPILQGQAVTFTATINPVPAGNSFGSVAFYDGTSLLKTQNVNALGIAVDTESNLSQGNHSITAVYSGNALFAPSTSFVLIESVSKAAITSTTTDLTASLNPATSGQSITFQASVTPVPTGASPGSISFYSGSTLLASVGLNTSGAASFATSLQAGHYSITAAYSGNGSYASSTSAAWLETVNAITNSSFTVQAPSAVSVNSSGASDISVSVVPEGGSFNGTVTMSASGLPDNFTGTWQPAALTPGSKTVTSVYVVTASGASGSEKSRQEKSKLPLASGLLGVGLCLGVGKKQRFGQSTRMLLSCIVLTMALALSGCAGGLGVAANQPSTPQNFTLTLTGTSGSLHSSTTVVVTVQ